MPSPRLIHFVDVAMSYPREGLLPQIVLVPGTISLPTDRRLAVLVRRHQGKTTLLQLLSGKTPTGSGRGHRCRQPIAGRQCGWDSCTRSSAPSRISDFWPELMASIPTSCSWRSTHFQPLDFPLDQPLKGRDGSQRRSLEAAIVFLLPFPMLPCG